MSLAVFALAAFVDSGNSQIPPRVPGQNPNATNKQKAGTTSTPSAIFAANSKAVAVIVAANAETAKLGTGFVIGKQGLVLTNFHVVEGTTAVGVKLPGSAAVSLVRRVTAYDVDNDLVILKMDGVDSEPVRVGDSDLVHAGQPIVVVGTPEGLEQTVSSGLVSAVRQPNGRRLFQISAPISPGSSGGPVFNDYGEVIAVVVGSIEAGQNLNFAVPINYARALMKSGTEQLISSLPRRSREKAQSQPPNVNASTDSGPPLADTLAWLVEKVGEAGYSSCHDEGKTRWCNRTRYQSVEGLDCRLSFTGVMDLIGRSTITSSSKGTISLRAVKPDITVESQTLSYPCGSPLPLINETPIKTCGTVSGDQVVFWVGRHGVSGVFFRSKDLAGRVARAMNHAITLCGKEPF